MRHPHVAKRARNRRRERRLARLRRPRLRYLSQTFPLFRWTMLSSEYTAEYAVGVDTAYPDVADAMAYYLVAKSAVLGFALEDGDRRRLIDIMGGGDP